MAIAENERNAELLLEKIFYYMNRLVDERDARQCRSCLLLVLG